MAQDKAVKVELFASGYCEAHERIVNPVSGKGIVRFYAIWALVEIPSVGFVLFDTGYSPFFNDCTQTFPNKVYRWATPVFITSDQTAKHILAQRGIHPDEVKYVILSHFHADHIAGMRDFPQSTFICSADALTQVKQLQGWGAVAKGIIHAFLPPDFLERVVSIEQFADFIDIDKQGITTYNLFGNKQFSLVALPGHAKGMLGFLLDTDQQKMLYATDASWSEATFRDNILPSPIVRLFFDSWRDYKQSLEALRAFKQNNPDFDVLFTHCPTTLKHLSNAV